MIDPDCPDASALGAGTMDKAQEVRRAQHLASCPRCRDFAITEAALRGIAARLAPSLPSPALLRFRAERRRLELARARAIVPLRLWTAVASLSAVGALIWLRDPLAALLAMADQQPAPTDSTGLALFALLVLAALVGLWLNAVEAPE